MFFLCICGTIIIAGLITAFTNWRENQPIIEEKEHPFYITRVNKETQYD